VTNMAHLSQLFLNEMGIIYLTICIISGKWSGTILESEVGHLFSVLCKLLRHAIFLPACAM
jgi:hypothetical protein